MENIMTKKPDPINLTNPQQLIFVLRSETLKKVVTDFKTTKGTMDEPLPTDGLLIPNIIGIPKFTPNHEITFVLEPKEESIQLCYVCFQNVTKSGRDNSIQWSSVFKNVSSDESITIPPDNSLYAAPHTSHKNTVSLTVQDNIGDEEYNLYYTILFSYTLQNNAKFFFSIDPLMKISSST
ncbi:hypothetical protein D1816_09495 [Aquimarina sp. AD10]|uniref:Uncharacterized protein n=1 Tax=Aquimarina aggregata TaxID=1642818 RepID=A0A162X1A1_9FLAO|nr:MULTISPECIES: hypothetical protein [Aquimarina]AXT60574.1 hypothetical protein D1816_09495 [Aquimarina sp. AD10]KZS38365.1 hypothetical protein AWE51_17570 [Aquimarina aggregata]RKN01666.1 hypothetical protein D7033_03360 [Aquimarina sp. AD10]